MAEEKKTIARKKPKFLRVEWHKKIKLGKGVKKNQRWHGAKGRHNKLRLNRKGRAAKPRVGWGSSHEIKNKVSGVDVVRVENVKMLEGLKGVGIMVGKIGKKKRMEIIAKANEMKLKILNRYREKAE
jgi:ribosomal protein L32E